MENAVRDDLIGSFKGGGLFPIAIQLREMTRSLIVIMDEKEKRALLGDINSFLDPGARAWYSNRGIPYRRGYLLHGPPGTGKSSLSLSIAGCFHLDIYILSLSSIREDGLNRLFAELPQHCVILLEDVDAVSETRSRDSEGEDCKDIGKVPLSALLNVLDGVASYEGRVLIITINHVEKLNADLVRPGRTDRKVGFSSRTRTWRPGSSTSSIGL